MIDCSEIDRLPHANLTGVIALNIRRETVAPWETISEHFPT
ncbi:MAG TPA: hypothetical protein VKX49_00355 [Bryobacteraceae bacterium]|jgi:hypothetical protein|nr:hypothetical protein [Bryobacteraceae bacterium]